MPEASLLRLIGSLALVIAAIAALAWASRKSGLLRSADPQQIRVLGSRSLGARHSLAIIELESVRLLLAISPQGVSLLHVLAPDPHAPAPAASALAPANEEARAGKPVLPEAPPPAAARQTFSVIMARLRHRP